MASISGGKHVPLPENKVISDIDGFSANLSTNATLLDISGTSGELTYLGASNTGNRLYKITVDGTIISDGTYSTAAIDRIGGSADETVNSLLVISKNPIQFDSSLKIEVEVVSGTAGTTCRYRTYK